MNAKIIYKITWKKCTSLLLTSNSANAFLKWRMLFINLQHISSTPNLKIATDRKMDSNNFEMYQVYIN